MHVSTIIFVLRGLEGGVFTIICVLRELEGGVFTIIRVLQGLDGIKYVFRWALVASWGPLPRQGGAWGAAWGC